MSNVTNVNAPISLEEVMNNNFDIICRMKTYIEYAKGDQDLLNKFVDKAIECVKQRIYSRREV